MSTRIGILVRNDPRRGLWRDAECLLWALEHKPVRQSGHNPAALSLFPVTDYSLVERRPDHARANDVKLECPAVVPKGTRFFDWLLQLDVLIVCEKLLPGVFARARRQSVRVVYIPNLDWASARGGVERWVQQIRKLGCEVWAKTERVAVTLDAAGVSCELVPWSIPDPVCRDRRVRQDGAVTFLINAGMGGWRNRRGVDIALKAFALTRQEVKDIRLIVKSIKPLARYIPRELLQEPGIQVIEGMIKRKDLMTLHERADAVLYPSRWEGFGLSLLEALHAGIPGIVTDGWPMNELIEHGHNGLLAPARNVGTMRLAPRWECSPAGLSKEMIRFARETELRRRLTCPVPSELISRQHRFVLQVRERLLREPAPRVVLFRPSSTPSWRRSEEYWADALRQHGYTVDEAFFESSLHEIQKCFAAPHDFVLVGKAPQSFLLSINPLTDRPIVLWHHDLSMRLRRWTQSVGELVDMLCVPESRLDRRISKLRAPVLTLLPGAKVDGNRGPGRRPTVLAAPDSGPSVVFLGSSTARGSRAAVLSTLSRHFDVHVYGKGWRHHGRNAHHAVWSTDAATVNRQAKIALSVSASFTTPHYTSNRLFGSCGAGACVVAEAYPGMDEHYPPEAVARFNGPDECARIIRQLLGDDARRAQMRAAAEDYTWRHHTWADRISQLLGKVTDVSITRRGYIFDVAARMWDQRARKLGARAVGHIRWTEAQFRAETTTLWQRLSPHIWRLRQSTDHTILDFGCGTGRFARKLAEEGFHVVGVDPSTAMLSMAAASPAKNIRFMHIKPRDPLPFAPAQFDALWVCTVLQHICDEALLEIVAELHRVVCRNGLLLLCENTDQTKGRTSRSGHVVFRRREEYLALFPGLAAVDEFVVEGERHTLLAGRLLHSKHELGLRGFNAIKDKFKRI
jgi:glycosyltransferase involved in cell wall biosynthesis/SAM-dependent methyltransferase